MRKKGSITVFLTLVLSLMLSLVCTSIRSAQTAAARTQILNGMDIGLYSLFGQYDRFLLKEYDLFFLEADGGSGKLNLAGVYDELESYMKPVLKQNSQKLSLKQGGFTGYRLATDQDGEVFYRQAVSYMKETLGIQGVSAVVDRMVNKGQQVEKAENDGEQAEQQNTLENYDSEMNTASQNSAQAAQDAASDQSGGDTSDGFTDGGSTAVSPEVKTEVVNPIPILKRIRRMSLLDLVVPASKGISDNSVAKSELISGRKTEQGLQLPDTVAVDSSKTSQLLFQEYLSTHMGNYTEPASGGLKYQMEYLLCGKMSDRDNLKKVASRLLLIREGVNAACLMSDSSKMMQIHALSAAIAAGFLVPPAAVAIEAALILCWTFAESILDVRELFCGGRVPLVKNAADWQLSLENLPNLLEGLDSQRKNCDNGMSYEDYLQVLLLTKGKSEILERGMDMTEVNVRKESNRSWFRLDHCIEEAEVSADVLANRRKTFTVTKRYSYT